MPFEKLPSCIVWAATAFVHTHDAAVHFTLYQHSVVPNSLPITFPVVTPPVTTLPPGALAAASHPHFASHCVIYRSHQGTSVCNGQFTSIKIIALLFERAIKYTYNPLPRRRWFFVNWLEYCFFFNVSS